MQAPYGPAELNSHESSEEKRRASEMQNFVISALTARTQHHLQYSYKISTKVENGPLILTTT